MRALGVKIFDNCGKIVGAKIAFDRQKFEKFTSIHNKQILHFSYFSFIRYESIENLKKHVCSSPPEIFNKTGHHFLLSLTNSEIFSHKMGIRYFLIIILFYF